MTSLNTSENKAFIINQLIDLKRQIIVVNKIQSVDHVMATCDNLSNPFFILVVGIQLKRKRSEKDHLGFCYLIFSGLKGT